MAEYIWHGVCWRHGRVQTYACCSSLPLWCQVFDAAGNQRCFAPLAVQIQRVASESIEEP